jgi:hypothetical protein
MMPWTSEMPLDLSQRSPDMIQWNHQLCVMFIGRPSDCGGWTSQKGEHNANLGVGITKRPRFPHYVFHATPFQGPFPS